MCAENRAADRVDVQLSHTVLAGSAIQCRRSDMRQSACDRGDCGVEYGVLRWQAGSAAIHEQENRLSITGDMTNSVVLLFGGLLQ